MRNNASAYDYSVTMTATFGILSLVTGTTTVLEIFAFAGGAVLAHALVDGVASGGFRHGPRAKRGHRARVLRKLRLGGDGAGHSARRGATGWRLGRLAPLRSAPFR